MSRFKAKDHFFHKAKKENYAARSVFKLEELDQKFSIFKGNQSVLDLGAAPGSWSQYACKKVGAGGRVVAIDLNPLALPNGIRLANLTEITDDAENLAAHLTAEQIDKGFDIVLSDMAPKTTGIKSTDQARSLELCRLALAMSSAFLRQSGVFVCKLFQSSEYNDFVKEVESDFKTVKSLKPDATRSMSKEIFIVGLAKKTAHNQRLEIPS